MTAAMADVICQRISEALAPSAIEVIDEGHLHKGHAGEGQGHYRVRMTSERFRGVLPIKRHRMIYDAVGGLMGDGIHALAIEAHAPGEPGAPAAP